MNKEINLESDEIQLNVESTDADHRDEDVAAEQHRLDPGVDETERDVLESTGGFDEDLLNEPGQAKSRKKRRRMFCFHCNRPEGHFFFYQDRWYYSFMIGLTFGLVKILGPFQCQCCGAKRWMISNSVNPRYWKHLSKINKKSSSRRRKKSRR